MALRMKWTRQRCQVRVEDLGNSGLEPFVGVRYDQLHATQAASHKASQEVCSERLSFGRANPHTQYVAPAVSVHGHGNYYGDRDDAPGLPHLDLSGVDPPVRPVAFQRANKEGVDTFIDLAGHPSP